MGARPSNTGARRSNTGARRSKPGVHPPFAGQNLLHVCSTNHTQSCLKIFFCWWVGWDSLIFQGWAALLNFQSWAALLNFPHKQTNNQTKNNLFAEKNNNGSEKDDLEKDDLEKDNLVLKYGPKQCIASRLGDKKCQTFFCTHLF